MICQRLAFRTFLAGTCALGMSATTAGDDFDALRLNQIQLIGTHNSYHVGPNDRDLKRAVRANSAASSLDYTHATLDVQLDRGVRSLALDLHDTTEGFEVFHIPRIDEGSTCRDFEDALKLIGNWSARHPRHVPIVVFLEIKEGAARSNSRFRTVDAAALAEIDKAIRAAFEPHQLLTPDDVRGTASNLREAVTRSGWPRLGESRGKVMFILNEQKGLRDAYAEGDAALTGKAMFVRSDETRRDAAFVVVGRPKGDKIDKLVQSGYIVRTRADANLREAREGDTQRRDAAIASGAHIITTDYPTGEPHPDTGYIVELPEAAAARVNPLNGPRELRGRSIPE